MEMANPPLSQTLYQPEIHLLYTNEMIYATDGSIIIILTTIAFMLSIQTFPLTYEDQTCFLLHVVVYFILIIITS